MCRLTIFANRPVAMGSKVSNILLNPLGKSLPQNLLGLMVQPCTLATAARRSCGGGQWSLHTDSTSDGWKELIGVAKAAADERLSDRIAVDAP